ncbi:MAG: hypothetical protein ACU0A2_06030 [Cognatishimia sp.]|uniref:hypothetical protein n=1 Tax=Cognatishimia sp. TaxID=2211648 RepID=UPI004058FD0A
MTLLDDLTFVKKAPTIQKSGGKTPLDKAREKFSSDIDSQIKLARDPNFEIVTQRKNRASGEIVSNRRKPKSWIAIVDGAAFITARFSNKPVPLGGKRGSVIKTTPNDAPQILARVKQWVDSGEADPLLEKLLAQSKRKSTK